MIFPTFWKNRTTLKIRNLFSHTISGPPVYISIITSKDGKKNVFAVKPFIALNHCKYDFLSFGNFWAPSDHFLRFFLGGGSETPFSDKPLSWKLELLQGQNRVFLGRKSILRAKKNIFPEFFFFRNFQKRYILSIRFECPPSNTGPCRITDKFKMVFSKPNTFFQIDFLNLILILSHLNNEFKVLTNQIFDFRIFGRDTWP